MEKPRTHKYALTDFLKEFPTDDACLEYIFRKKYPNHKGWYKLKGRKCYSDSKGKQIYPLKGTIFQGSSTSLVKWFFAIYLFSQSKNGVSAAELRRHLCVTEKCAWRMANRIRTLMHQNTDLLSGVIEVDETYYGPYERRGQGRNRKSPIVGTVQRNGEVRALVISKIENHVLINHIKNTVKPGSYVLSDELPAYRKWVPRVGYLHASINHGRKEYGRGDIHTNTIEGFWGHLKTSLRGTYHFVSKKHLQSYVDEFAFHYNFRGKDPFPSLMERL